MPKINRYQDISEVDREARKDYIDRHSPFVHSGDSAKQGEKFPVTVKVGNEYAHPDDNDHYIQYIQLFNGETLLGEAKFVAGMLGGQDHKGQAEVTFQVVPTGNKMNLVAHAYCTKHGIWESDPKEVAVS